MKTEHEKFEERQRENRGKEPTEDYLRHNYTDRVAAARNEADRLGEPPLKKATLVWEHMEERLQNPPATATCTCGDGTMDLGAEHNSDCPYYSS